MDSMVDEVSVHACGSCRICPVKILVGVGGFIEKEVERLINSCLSLPRYLVLSGFVPQG